MYKILIIEDDKAIAEIEADYLHLSDFIVDISYDGLDGLNKAQSGQYDLILLDLMLPGMDGFLICKTLRQSLDIPILIVTARMEDIDKIRGLGYGADDYIEKPFSPSVLVARVKANLAQYQRLKSSGIKKTSNLKVGEFSILKDSMQVFLSGREIKLKNKEYELFVFFAEHPNQVFSREDLYEYIWGLESMGDNATVAVHINRLREKIEEDPANPKYICTIWGAGYRFTL
jgi:DNA-binding response OmpR family regulator